MMTDSSWFVCKSKAKDHKKYNLTIPALCVEAFIARKYINFTSLQTVMIAKLEANKHKYDNIKKGVVIFLQIFFNTLALFSALLCLYRFIQLSLYDTKKISFGKFSFFLVFFL